MQNIYDILGGIGVTVPEDKKADFDKAVNENYKTVAEVEKIEAKRDLYKSQLDETQTALKGYEGVNVEELRGKISTLEKAITDMETKHAADDAERDFQGELEKAMRSAGVRDNDKARAGVMKGLELESLRASKNRSKDIADAIDKIKADPDNNFLFNSETPLLRISGSVNSTPQHTASPTEAANEALRSFIK